MDQPANTAWSVGEREQISAQTQPPSALAVLECSLIALPSVGGGQLDTNARVSERACNLICLQPVNTGQSLIR